MSRSHSVGEVGMAGTLQAVAVVAAAAAAAVVVEAERSRTVDFYR
jgi:hypothetical protein